MSTESEIHERLTIDQVIYALKYYDVEKPTAALQSAVRYGDEIVPALIHEIKTAVADVRDGEFVPTSSHWIAVILLTALGTREALPVILDAFRTDANWDSDLTSPLFGDMLTESLKNVIAQLAENPQILTADIEDAFNNEFYRAALVDGIFGMVVEGRLSRAEAVQFLSELTEKAIERRDTELLTSLTSTLTDLADTDSLDLIMRALDLNLVNADVVDHEFCRESFAEGEQFFERQCAVFRETRISDPVKDFDRWACRRADVQSPENVNEAIEWILNGDDDALASDAVRWLRNHRDEATPRLIQLLRDAQTVANDDDDDDDDRDWHSTVGHQIAAVLLTEFGAKLALPVLLDGVCSLNPYIVDRFDRIIQYYLDQIVGRLADDPSQFRSLADDPDVDDSVRIELVDAVFWMVVEGKLTREAAIEYLRQWLALAIGESDEELATSIAWALLDLGAKQAEPEILQAIQAGSVNEYSLGEDEVEETLRDPEQNFQESLSIRRKRRIEHSVFEVESWFGLADELDDPEESDDQFGDRENDERAPFTLPRGLDPAGAIQYVNGLESLRQMRLNEKAREPDPDDEYYPPAAETIRKTDPKVGRNDPCPCGSGKKYKKCCLKGDG